MLNTDKPGAALPALAVTVSEAAQVTRTTRDLIYREIRNGKLPARRAGKAFIIEIAALQQWLQSLPEAGY